MAGTGLTTLGKITIPLHALLLTDAFVRYLPLSGTVKDLFASKAQQENPSTDQKTACHHSLWQPEVDFWISCLFD